MLKNGKIQKTSAKRDSKKKRSSSSRRKAIEKIHERNSWFFEVINKIGELLARLTKEKKRERHKFAT